ncbi:WecB/TagA/CpsF family glycosyltransferase [Pontibacter beigongshangensis]|uniref:WecB/TagA/CpsF family glycosyltransferase n=1 Tax=Pontibacter beigongshangensis TaxID=2574733 RepID=UPI001650825D|nr:WecB/TagA/CpsF family glycosyltransferase [Pontibacter beigongshangensis]
MLFGYNVYLKNRNHLIEELKQRIAEGQTSTIISLNTLKLHQGSKNKELRDLFQAGTYTIPDGQSIVFAEYLVHGNKISSISGAELMVELIKESDKEGHRIFFLGSPEALLGKVKDKIGREYPGLTNKVCFQHGYYAKENEAEVIEKIAAFRPDFLFVAFGSPRKEEFIVKYSSMLHAKVIMGVGGSFEYFVGDVKLDQLSKKLGLRWFIRTLQDPRRLAKRYAVCNTYFLFALLREIFKNRILHIKA